MFTNPFRITIRSLWKNKAFALINITGLSIAILCAQMIWLYVKNESSYDNFHKNAPNTYRVVTDFKFNDVLDHLALSPPPLAPALLQDYPEVVRTTQLTQYNQGKTLVKADEKKIYLENIFFADSDFFNIFTYHVSAGDIKNALTTPNCVVLTESTSKLFFGTGNAIGKTLSFDLNDGTFAPYKVTGVIEDPPLNSHLKFTALTSMPGLWNIYPEQVKQDWVFAFMYTYIQLKDGTNPLAFQNKIKDLYQRKNQVQPDGVKAGCNFILEPLKDIHLRSSRIWDVSVPGNPDYIKIFALTGLMILLLAGINYINLATARAASRSKEMGIRKVAGASRLQLIVMVMSEVAVVCVTGMLLACILSFFSLGILVRLTGIAFTYQDLLSPLMIIATICITLFISLISGIYPGLYISRTQPVQALRSKLAGMSDHLKWKGITVRKTLVVFQFVISVTMIIATIVVHRQLNYMLNKDPGFERDQVVAVMLQDTLVASKFEGLKHELEQLPAVKMVSFSASIPGGPPDRKITKVEGATPADLKEIPTQPVFMDFSYPQLMGFQLKEGEFIQPDSGLGFRNAFLVNEAAVEKFGWDKGLGKRIVYGFSPRNLRDGKVVGVLKNVQTTSFKEAPEPMIFMVYKKPYAQTFVSVKLKGGDLQSNLHELEKVFNHFDPAHPFDPVILDQSIRKLYEGEIRMSRLFSIFSFITIMIACMGLLGLISFNVQQRTREIGIRKVLGASAGQIMLAVTTEFALLILIAFLIAAPISTYAMNRWLNGFATRITLDNSVYIIAAGATLLITFITIGYHTARAAMANPVHSLRYE